MRKLLNANLTRIFKSKIFYYGIVFIAALAVLMVFFASDEGTFSVGIGAGMGAMMVLPMIISIISAVMILPEFSSGTIRNKIVVGHNRNAIVISWAICFSLITAVFFVVYEAVSFLSAMVFSYDFSELKINIVFANLLVVAVLLASNAMFSLLICTMLRDVASIAVLFLIQEPLAILSTLLMDFMEDNKVLTFMLRFFPQGQVQTINMTVMPDKPWLTVLCSASLGIVFLIMSIAYFKKTDLK